MRVDHETQVVVRFPRTTELLTLAEPPLVGQRVADRSGDVWFVIEVLRSGRSVFTVRCADLPGLADRMSTPDDLPTGLLRLARKVVRSHEVATAGHVVARGLRARQRRYEFWLDRYLAHWEGSERRTFAVTRAGRSEQFDEWIDRYLRSSFGQAEIASHTPAAGS